MDFLNNKNENSEGLLTAVEGENVTVVKCESPSLPYSTYLVFGKGLKFVVTGFSEVLLPLVLNRVRNMKGCLKS